MKIPDYIQIAGTTYHILKIPEGKRVDEGNSLKVGNINFRLQEIRISEDCEKDMQGVTFWHETLHAVFMMLGLTEQETYIDESFVDTLAHLLYQIGEQVINENKKEK